LDLMQAYLAFLETVLITLVPALAALTIFSWVLAWRRRMYRLPTILAVVNTIVGGCSGWLAFTVMYRSRVGPVPIEFLPITATVLVLLCCVPFVTTLYLVWLETRRGAQDRRRTNRPVAKDRRGE
jgi:hypothetical protein